MWRNWSLALLVLGGTAGPAGAGEPLRIRVPHAAGTAVRRAVLAARERLADPECGRVFTDFESTTLRVPLGALLESWGRTPAQHLESLVFKDGSGTPACASAEVLAHTRVGADTVYICAAQFGRAVARNPTFAEVVLIHELLHTVGLGENPPTSGEITARVAERCGHWRARRPAEGRVAYRK
jgi:hypothetical protein